ncbi:MAG: hypothetical protein PHS45_02210 [Bacilli bacterium]|nr:hypothetical protein [Bacilli bacterium]
MNEKYKNNNNNQLPPTSKCPPFPDFSIQDLFIKGKCLDIVAAVLLLTGKLKVDSVEIFRGSPIVSVTLLGKYLTCDEEKTNALLDFLEENGDMTLDDVFEALQTRMEKERNK